MTYFSIRFARLSALAALLITAGCTINSTTYSSNDPSSGDEAEKDKDKPKKDDKPKDDEPKGDEDDEPEAKPKPKPEKEKPTAEKPKDDKPKDDKPASKPDKPKEDKPKDDKPEDDKPASKPDKPKDEPVVEKPAEEKPAPQPEHSKIVLPVKISLDALEKELEALVPQTDKKDWTRVTKGEESPKADLKYELWRDPIKVELEGNTFHITVPVRYASTIRAQVKNPITKDWFWIAKDETWGTKQEPQHLTAYFEAKVEVEDDWDIKSDLKLVKLEHGKPPSGEICKTVAVKVCVAKASIADEVREGIDKRLEPKLRKALEQIDGKVEHALDLEKRAAKVWAQLQAPQKLPIATEAWLVVRPSAVGVTRPGKDGGDVRVDLLMEGRLNVETGPKPKVKAVPLPKIAKVEGDPGFHVVTDFKVARSLITGTIEKAIKGLTVSGKNKTKPAVVRAQLTATPDDTHPNRVTLKVAFNENAADELELRGDLAYDADRQRVSIKNIDATPAAKAAATKLGIDVADVEKVIATKATWNLADDVAPLRKAIQTALDGALQGQANLRGELKQLDVQKLELKPDTLEARLIVGGALEVELKR